MRAWIAAIFIVALVGSMVVFRLVNELKPPLPVLGQVPSFQFTDSSGDVWHSSHLDGKVWVVDFFFTSCAGPCPAMSKNMSLIHETFKSDPRVAQLSVSVHPEFDTPDILAQYAKKFKANTEIWQFVTGPEEDVLQLSVGGFKIGDPESVINHSQRFVLVDGQGAIRGYYNGTDDQDIARLISDLPRLL
ncbi:MAG: SCO family protein [Acidobacteria bacterium]|nr:SCO family protein [Acidobacteriota bacterium]